MQGCLCHHGRVLLTLQGHNPTKNHRAANRVCLSNPSLSCWLTSRDAFPQAALWVTFCHLQLRNENSKWQTLALWCLPQSISIPHYSHFYHGLHRNDKTHKVQYFFQLQLNSKSCGSYSAGTKQHSPTLHSWMIGRMLKIHEVALLSWMEDLDHFSLQELAMDQNTTNIYSL